MPIDTFVDIHPKRIKSSEEVDRILSKIKKFEREKKCSAGVVIIQNRQLGGIYEIVSREEATDGINNPRKVEAYVAFYPLSYFEELREKLERESKSKQYN